MIETEALREVVMETRRFSIFTPEGRIFLKATADIYGYDVDEDGKITDIDGLEVTESHEDYQRIVSRAQRQAMVESTIGQELLTDA